MEWNRAKNILIILFLIIDIGLGIIILNQSNKSITVGNREIEECRKILRENKFVLKCNIPRNINALATIPFRNIVYSENYSKKYNNAASRYVEVSSDGIFKLKETFYPGYNINNSEKVILRDINQILKVNRINTVYRKNKPVFKKTSQDVTVEYGQKYNGYNIANSILKVTIDKVSGIYEIDYRWYIPEKNSNMSEQLVSPLDSLIVMMNEIRASNKDKIYIKDVRIGYFAEKSIKRAKTIEAVPVWEITVSDKGVKQTYYVDAYENKLKRG